MLQSDAMEIKARQTDGRTSVYEEGQSRLCDFCRNLLGLKLSFYTHGSYPSLGFCGLEDRRVNDDRPYRVLEDFQQAVLDGCHLCFIFWSYLLEETRACAKESEVVAYNVWGCDTPDDTTPNIHAIQLMFKLWNGGSQTVRALSALVSLVPTTAMQSSMTEISMEIQESSDSKRAFDIAKQWLKECSGKHVVCERLMSSEAFLPTRLLDIKHHENDPVCLCLSENLNSQTKYMTLSHCWGGKVPLTLTSATLVKFFQEIPFPELPKTFQEAIRITRQLGIRYLWIDSLCIIQGSNEDWKREAAMMGEVYRHSWCNIAATKAKDGLGGCFDNRDPKLVTPCKVTTTWPGRPRETYYCMSDDIWATQIDDSPLSSRGWVLQEIMLSPRVLHYAKGQVFWECSELRACESHPGGPDFTLNEATKINMDPDTIRERHNRLFKYTPPSHDKHYVWDNAVHEYSKRDLTFPQKDIFLAISGIARLLIPEKEYLAGLWNSPETIIEQLLWHTQLDSSAKRSPVYRAPSWSWASLDSNGLNHVGYESRVGTESESSVDDHLNYTHALIKVLEAEVILEDIRDAYGVITNGHMNLKGTIVSSTISIKGQLSTAMCLFGTSIAMHLNHDFGDLHEDSKVYCLPVRLDTSEEHYERGSIDYLHGLILEPTNLRDDEYYRRGYFSVENVDPSVDSEDDEHSANILRFWNMVLQNPINASNDQMGELHLQDLIPEDLEANWTSIRLI